MLMFIKQFYIKTFSIKSSNYPKLPFLLNVFFSDSPWKYMLD